MATAKQLAWRKKFAAMAKAGTLRKRRKNPAKKTARKTVARKTAINKPSQITKRAPTKRLKTRRAANSKPGYFPNPTTPRGGFRYKVQVWKANKWKTIATFAEKEPAKQYARAVNDLGQYTAVRVWDGA